MESLETTDIGLQAGAKNDVAVCDEEISTDELQKVFIEDQNITSGVLLSHSKPPTDGETIPASVCVQDGRACQINSQCSELNHESTLPAQLIPEIINSVTSNVAEMSPCRRIDTEENSEVILKSVSVTVDDKCAASNSRETDCGDDDDDRLLRSKASVISKDLFQNATSQEDSCLSQNTVNESPPILPSDDHSLDSGAIATSKDQLKVADSQEDSSLSQNTIDESQILQSDLSQEIDNSLLRENNASPQATIVTLQEARVRLQKAIDSLQENNISARQDSNVSSQSDSVSSGEASSEVCISSQETSASLQGTSIRRETALDENVVKEKILSCGLDLVCDNDSQETSFEDKTSVRSSRLANYNSSFRRDTQVATKSKKRRRTPEVSPARDKVPIASSTKPEWFKPFEDGWCREVVLRKEVVTSGVRPADIYYYSPNGKKLRSMPEVIQHLKDNNYSLDTSCFTFSKFAIYKQPFETVRSAGEHGGKSAKSSPILRSARKSSPSSPSSHVNKKLKAFATTTSSIDDVRRKNVRIMPRKRLLPAEDSKGNNGTDVKRSKLVEKNFPPEVVGQKLCGLNCPGSRGVAPTIPCDNCMCMFHATCIRMPAASTSFTCQNCQIQQKTSTVEATSVSTCAPIGFPSLRPLTLHTNTTTKQRPNISGVRGPPPLQRANTRAPPTLVIAPTQAPPMMLPMHLVRPFCVTTSSSAYQPMQSSAPGIPQSGVFTGSVTSGNLIQSSAFLSQPTRQLRLVLPPKVVTQLNLEKPLALKINGQQLLLQPNEFIPIENGIKVLLPESLIAKSGPIVESVNKSIAKRVVKSKAPTHVTANDKCGVCVIDPYPSVPPAVTAKSSYMTTMPQTVRMALEKLNGKSALHLTDISVAKQPSEAAVEKCPSPDVAVSMNVQTSGAGEETAMKSVQQMSATNQMHSLVSAGKTNQLTSNADVVVVGSLVESRPLVIRVDSDTDSDSELNLLPCEPLVDVSTVTSSSTSSGVLPPYVVAPLSSSPTSNAAAPVTSCPVTSSCDVLLVSPPALGMTSAAVTPLVSLPALGVTSTAGTPLVSLPASTALTPLVSLPALGVTSTAGTPLVSLPALGVTSTAVTPFVSLPALGVTSAAVTPLVSLPALGVTSTAVAPLVSLPALGVTSTAVTPLVPLPALDMTSTAGTPLVPLPVLGVTTTDVTPLVPLPVLGVTTTDVTPLLPLPVLGMTTTDVTPLVPLTVLGMTTTSVTPLVPLPVLGMSTTAVAPLVPLPVLGMSTTPVTPLVPLPVLGMTTPALTSQPLLLSCVVSFSTSTVSSTLPIGFSNGDSVSDASEDVPAAGPASLSSASTQTTTEHFTSDPTTNHSKDVTDSAAKTDELSETVQAVIDKQVTSASGKRCVAFKRACSDFGMLHAGFNAMFHIFKHLGVCDLLRAATVCKTWHKLVKDEELWRSICFRGCRVKNWRQAAVHFQRMNTHRLDFRGMLPSVSGGCPWLGMAESLPCLRALQQVDFGQCSAKVLSVAGEAFPNVQSVTAEIVTFNASDSTSGSSCPEFDPTKLADLHALVCLKVRGVPGIALPTNSDATRALRNLGHLTQLRNLSLTTLRGIEGKDFSFIESLSQLRVLELGNCLNWTKETFGNLATLINLTNLRLECGGGDPVDAGLGDALKKLTNLQHLELIRYFVADNLAIVFPTLIHLKTFFIWPELQENEVLVGRQNSIILSAVSGMPFLQRLFWGITINNQTSTSSAASAAASAEDASSSAVSRQAAIPFLLRGSASVDQRALSTRRLTIKEIVSALSDRLPSTEIRVFQVPAQSH